MSLSNWLIVNPCGSAHCYRLNAQVWKYVKRFANEVQRVRPIDPFNFNISIFLLSGAFLQPYLFGKCHPKQQDQVPLMWSGLLARSRSSTAGFLCDLLILIKDAYDNDTHLKVTGNNESQAEGSEISETCHEKRSRIGAVPKIPKIDEKTCCTRWAKSIKSIAAVFGCTTFTKPQCSRISLVGPGKTPYHVQHSRQLPPEKHGLEPQVLRQWMQQHLHAPLPSFFRVAASHSAIETRDWQRCRDRVAVHHAYVWWLRHGLTPKVYSVL